MIESLLIKHSDESIQDYKIRCFQYKYLHPDVSWLEFAETLNDALDDFKSPDAYRKQYKRWCEQYMECESEEQTVAENTTEPPMPNVVEGDTEKSDDTEDLKLLRLKKMLVQISDERVQNNAYIRKMSREETIKEIAFDFARVMSDKKLLSPPKFDIPAEAEIEGILMISDWHYGIDVDNYFNVYNPDICRDRIGQLRDKVIHFGKLYGINKLHCVNLSDLISGRIHNTIRLENRIDVITQIMQVSEIVAELLSDLSAKFYIEYRDVTDNHSRLEPNKKDSLELETLTRIIPWYLEQRLRDNDRVKILYNTYADDIISFRSMGWEVVGVHGHKDKPTQVIDNMTHMTRKVPDLVLTAHLHHWAGEEEHECVRLSNGSLMGVDTFAQDLRLTSRPSQTFIAVSKDNVTEGIHKINLK